MRVNDFVFAVHAVILSSITYSQFWPKIWGLAVSRHQKSSKPVRGIFWSLLAAVGIVICVVLGKSPDGGYDPGSWAWIDVVSNIEIYLSIAYTHTKKQIYSLSYVKLVVTVVKYVPQAWLNFKRQSTDGWRIEMILLDFSGGILSLAQLVIDSSFNQDWSGLTGNPAKFILSNVSIVFDLLFMVQHYILYGDNNREEDKATRRNPSLVTPLLSEPDELSRAAYVDV